MDFYTLTDTFLAKDPIDEFVSAIWTERYSVAGDVQIVTQASPELIEKLAPGTYLSLRGSKETMILQTQSIENKLLTVIGTTLIKFLDNRIVWFKNPDYHSTNNPERIVDYTEKSAVPGQFIANVVNLTAINPTSLGGGGTPWEKVNLNWPFERIEHLTLGPIDTTGTPERLTIPIGPLYEGIANLAANKGLGMSLYLESASPVTGFSLKFKTYRGVDHSTGGAGELVRLIPELDAIQNIKELRSTANYKNVAYVYYQGELSRHVEGSVLPEPENFERRSMMVTPAGEPIGRTEVRNWYGGYVQLVVGPADILAFRNQAAKDALANNNYIRAVDGETSPSNADYKFGVHYGLGDIIELQGLTGTLSKARITEYIRSQDQNGEREYPTISIQNPTPT